MSTRNASLPYKEFQTFSSDHEKRSGKIFQLKFSFGGKFAQNVSRNACDCVQKFQINSNHECEPDIYRMLLYLATNNYLHLWHFLKIAIITVWQCTFISINQRECFFVCDESTFYAGINIILFRCRWTSYDYVRDLDMTWALI